MKIMVIYDSQFGNTEKIATVISSALASQADVTTIRVKEVRAERLAGLDLLIVGSPTQRFNATTATSVLINEISKDGLEGIKVATFDTRLPLSEIRKTPVLAFFVRLVGNAYAAKHIADSLKKKGGAIIAAPEGFFVAGMEGPLVEGEIERAEKWVKGIVEKLR